MIVISTLMDTLNLSYLLSSILRILNSVEFQRRFRIATCKTSSYLTHRGEKKEAELKPEELEEELEKIARELRPDRESKGYSKHSNSK